MLHITYPGSTSQSRLQWPKETIDCTQRQNIENRFTLINTQITVEETVGRDCRI